MRKPANERERIARLRSLNVLDEALDGPFKALAQVAGELSGCAAAYISFIEENIQIIRSSYNFPLHELVRQDAICSETILSEDPLIIENLLGEPRFSNTALTQNPLDIRFYAGFPIYTKDRCVIGTLCITNPRPLKLSTAQVSTLKSLAQQVIANLELHNKLSAVRRTISSLEDSEQRFRRIADASPVLLWISDQSGNRTLSNRAWCDFTGLNQEESLADCWRKALHPDDASVYQSKWDECARAHTKFQHEYRLRHCSETYRWVMEQAIPLFSSTGRLEAYVSSCVDLSLRSSDELQYQHNEARFRAVSEAAPLGIVVTDYNGACIYSNHRFQAISGLSADENLGTGWLKTVHTDDRGAIQLAWEEAMRTAQTFEHTLRYQRPDGTLSWCSVKAAAINATDTVSGWVSTIEDITAKRIAEEQLIAAKQAAESATHSKSQFLANMSHEIRTPLTAIIGFADALKQEDSIRTNHRQCLDVIINNGRHLLNIINQILDLSKIDAGALTIEQHRYELISLIDDLKLMFAPAISEKSLAFEVDYKWPLPQFITTDSLRLKQVLINLLGNAIKFTSQGTVTLCISWDAGNNELNFAVKDTGIGMSFEQADKIFKPFYQANQSTTRIFGGTGLGLSISQRLIQALGGSITVESKPGIGSTFSFFIKSLETSDTPLIERYPSKPKPLQVPEPESNPLFAAKILFADDALDNRRLVELLLRRTGAQVVLVENGQEAIDTAEKESFDLILMDIQMPLVDGLTATKKIREAGIETPIVALSAGAMPSDVARAIEAGCCMHLSKPFERSDFYQALSKYIRPRKDSTGNQVIKPIYSSISDTDPEMRELIAEFADGLSHRISEIADAAAKNNLTTVAAFAHKLKGSAGMYGYPEIAKLAANLDQAAKQRLPAAVIQIISDLKSLIPSVEYGVAFTGNAGKPATTHHNRAS